MASIQPLTFSQLLKRFRRAAGLTQEELAERAGLSVEGISALERGVNRIPRRDTVELLAEALNLSAHEQALFAAAARGRPAPEAALAHARTPFAGTSTTLPLVGRAHELGTLEHHLVATSANGALLVAGEPGIGKTRLLQEAAGVAVGMGWRVLTGGCTRRSGQEPYSPLLETVAGFLRTRLPVQLRVDLEGCAWLVRLLPELAEQAVVPAPSWTLPPDQERRLMFAAVARFLVNVAGPTGTLLVLDDLQWASADALHLLAVLLQSSGAGASSPKPPAPRLLGAYRSTEVRTQDPLGLWLSEHAALGLATHLTLGPLPPEAAVELLDRLLADQDEGNGAGRLPRAAGSAAGTTTGPQTFTAADLRQQVLQRAEGVPFFLVSCAQGLLTGALTVNAEPPTTAPAAQGAPGQSPDAIPWDVAQSIRRRVTALPDPARVLLGIAAVAGRVVRRHDLLTVALQAGRELPDGDAVLTALEAVTHAGLLIETGDEAYAFAHDLIREVTLTDLSAARREAWHRRVGEALERHAQQSERRVAELAYHFARSGDWDKAITYLERAGDLAEAVQAHAESEAYYRECVERLAALSRPTDVARVWVKLGSALRAQVRYDEALAALERAGAIFAAVDERRGWLRAMAQLGRVHVFRGTPQEGVERLTRVALTVRDNEQSSEVALLYVTLAELLLFCGRHSEQAAAAEHGAEIARAIRDDRLLAHAQMREVQALHLLGRFCEGMRIVEEALPSIEQSGDLTTLRLALFHGGMLHEALGALEEARRYQDRALDVARRLADATLVASTLVRCGLNAYYRGEWRQADEAFSEVRSIVHEVRYSWVSAYAPCATGLLLLARGELDAGSDAMRQAMLEAERSRDSVVSAYAYTVLAERDLLDGRPQDAHTYLDPLLARLGEHSGLTPMLLPMFAWALSDMGRESDAECVVVLSVDQGRGEDCRLWLVDSLRVQAQLATGRRSWKAAQDAIEESLMLCRAMPYPYAEAKALYVYGQLHAVKGETEQAREKYEAAIAICERLGEGLYRPHIERALAELA